MRMFKRRTTNDYDAADTTTRTTTTDGRADYTEAPTRETSDYTEAPPRDTSAYTEAPGPDTYDRRPWHHGPTRALITLLAAGVAGLFGYVATQIGVDSNGGYWAAYGILA